MIDSTAVASCNFKVTLLLLSSSNFEYNRREKFDLDADLHADSWIVSPSKIAITIKSMSST